MRRSLANPYGLMWPTSQLQDRYKKRESYVSNKREEDAEINISGLSKYLVENMEVVTSLEKRGSNSKEESEDEDVNESTKSHESKTMKSDPPSFKASLIACLDSNRAKKEKRRQTFSQFDVTVNSNHP